MGMINEIKSQRMRYDINRYLSNLTIIRHPHNTYYYNNGAFIINKSHIYRKLYLNEKNIFVILPRNIDIDLFLEMIDEQINIERYDIVYKLGF